MIIGFDLQLLELAAKEGASAQARCLLQAMLTIWREQFPDDRLIGFSCAPLNAADLSLDEYRRWELTHPKEELLDAGPMASHAWRPDCLELDWLIVPEPLIPELLPPGGAPCRLAALLIDPPDNLPQLIEQSRTQPGNPHLKERNTLQARWRVIEQYERVFVFTEKQTQAPELPEHFAEKIGWISAPAETFTTPTVESAADIVRQLRQQLVQRQGAFPQAPPVKSTKLRLALFTPVRPVRSGVADYIETLIEHLVDAFAVTVFTDGVQPANEALLQKVSWRHRADFASWRRAAGERVLPLYQLGNNECHRAFFELARLVPGVVELHDAVPVFYGMHLDNYWKNRAEWLDLVEAEFGRPYAELKEELPQDDLMYAPMIKALTEGARGCIVHNEWCAKLVREARPGLPLVNTGHGANLAPPPNFDQAKRAAVLARWGIPPNAVVFAAMGAIEQNRRLEELLTAFYIARRIDRRLVLVFTGESSHRNIIDWLNSTAEAYGISDCVKQLGYLALDELEALIQQVDVGVNLRWPTLGEASGMVTRLMAASKPVLITRAKQFLEYPDDACWKIPQGDHEIEALAQAMVALARHPERRRELGRRARRYIERFSWDNVAQTYIDFLTSLIA